MTLLLLFNDHVGGGGGVAQTVTMQAQASLTGMSIRLRSRLTGAIVATESAAETASGSGVYSANFTDVAAGTYYAQFIRDSDSAIIRSWDVALTLTTATFPVDGGVGAAGMVLRGGLTHAEAIDLLVAAAIGLTSQPDDDNETFLFRDGGDAFTTTFDSNGNRTAVVLH